MPPRQRPKKTPAASDAPSKCTATTDLTQLTWVVAGRTFSREFTDPNDPGLRAARLRRLTSGARDVSTNKIRAGQTYTVHGEF